MMTPSFPQLNLDKPLGGRYKVIGRLGTGGFGQTFLALDMHLPGHPRCVVKQLKPRTSDTTTLQMARRCFDTEAQVLYRLGNHDQIPRLLAHFEDNDEFYLAQELVDGEPLSRELVEGKPWSSVRTVLLLKDILQVLSFVHDQQVIHRDLKPSNLIRRRQDQKIVLIDFGAVKQLSSQTVDPQTGATNLTISIGTQGYMPNEQVAGKPRFSSDIYALGIIALQALTGIHPKHFEEDTRGEIAWHHHAEQTNPELVALLDRMVCYDFRDRYADAMEALEALNQLPAELFDPSNMTDLDLEGALFPDQISGPLGALDLVNSASGSASGERIISRAGGSNAEVWMPTESMIPPTTPELTEVVDHPHARNSSSTANQSASIGVSERSRWLPALILGAIAATIGGTYSLTTTFLQTSVADPSTPTATASLPSPSTPALTPEQQTAAILQEATKLMESGQYEEALALYDRAITLTPNAAAPYAGRCEVLNRLQRPEEALVSCNDALAFQPDYPEAMWSKGNALLLQDKAFEALKIYADVTELKPDFAAAWVKRGVALQTLGRSAEALKMLDKGIELYRNSSEAWLTRGQALLTLRRYDEAIASLDKVLQLEPDNATAQQLRETAKARSGR